jgi:hypothetical protein
MLSSSGSEEVNPMDFEVETWIGSCAQFLREKPGSRRSPLLFSKPVLDSFGSADQPELLTLPALGTSIILWGFCAHGQVRQ